MRARSCRRQKKANSEKRTIICVSGRNTCIMPPIAASGRRWAAV
jgi:hypothetical protein